ncbi:Bifunctional transcriptional activator/DNA repair enzyme Ada [bioreactor metagenome]|uniref:methylated-DNA--[protein]-cysteine S-methyltransferase n=1 Tax=bioreactor metagenome TaxID=1076179 RepID=A0A645E815_9ZZZZ
MDGLFYYAVKSTGIFCRPSCKSKTPVRENVVFFDCCEDARVAGFRPCKRCRPDLATYQPIADVARQTKSILAQYYAQRQQLAAEMQKLGVSKRRIGQIFKAHYGVSLSAYVNNLKLQAAMQQLQESALPVIDIAYSIGFESLSAFFAFFRKNTGMTPNEFRKYKGKPPLDINAYYAVYDTPLGQITIACRGSAVAAVQFGHKIPSGAQEKRTDLMDRAASALNEYFSGSRKSFDIPIAPQGTPFQMNVWAAISQIPYGETRTYKEIAAAVGKPGASRAIGMAANKNMILLLIPCHRVIGADGSLVGYAGGLDIKEKLLRIERNNPS